MLSAKAALLSVIIPVYNVEPYLEQCLDSVINQTYKNLEIICINDGSTDNSLKILEKYQKKDSRIKLINQKNKGLSGARNAGLDVAKGEYIAFVDSDDYLELNAYEEAMKVMLTDKNVDIVQFGIICFPNDGNVETAQRAHNTSKYFEYLLMSHKYTPNVCNKVFKSNIIQNVNLRFINKLIYEDVYFSTSYSLICNQSCFINMPFYNYRIRGNSITGSENNNNNKKYMDLYYNYDALVDFAKKHNIYEAKKDFIYGQYIEQISKFCNDDKLLMEAMNHLDSKILNSDCHDYLKLKYLKKRNKISYEIEHPL